MAHTRSSLLATVSPRSPRITVTLTMSAPGTPRFTCSTLRCRTRPRSSSSSRILARAARSAVTSSRRRTSSGSASSVTASSVTSSSNMTWHLLAHLAAPLRRSPAPRPASARNASAGGFHHASTAVAEAPSACGRIAEPAREPGTDAFLDVGLVGSLGEGMVLARVDHQLVLGADQRERPVEVDRLADRDVGVVLAVQDQHRRGDVTRVADRAELVVAVRAGPVPAEAAAQVGLCPAELAGADLHGPVGYARAHHRGAEAAGLGDRPGGHAPAGA